MRVNGPICIVTVDAEEEWDWKNGFPEPPFSTENIEQIPVFQNFCAQFGVLPTYFIDHAVASEVAHVQMFKKYFDAGQCDIGAQLHCWSTPPFLETLNEFNSHAVNLHEDVVHAKLSELTDKLMQSFQVHPFSFRCGRWGMNGAILKMLQSFGYRVDASVRPFYEDASFSYTNAPLQPYFPSFNEITTVGNQREILEIPVTEGFNRRPFHVMNNIHNKLCHEPYRRFYMNGTLWKSGVLKKISLTPEGFNAADLCKCIDMHVRNGSDVIQLFFHSSDLLPGCTPYVKDEKDLERFYETLGECFDNLKNVHSAQFLTIREAHATILDWSADVKQVS